MIPILLGVIPPVANRETLHIHILLFFLMQQQIASSLNIYTISDLLRMLPGTAVHHSERCQRTAHKKETRRSRLSRPQDRNADGIVPGRQ